MDFLFILALPVLIHGRLLCIRHDDTVSTFFIYRRFIFKFRIEKKFKTFKYIYMGYTCSSRFSSRVFIIQLYTFFQVYQKATKSYSHLTSIEQKRHRAIKIGRTKNLNDGDRLNSLSIAGGGIQGRTETMWPLREWLEICPAKKLPLTPLQVFLFYH